MDASNAPDTSFLGRGIQLFLIVGLDAPVSEAARVMLRAAATFPFDFAVGFAVFAGTDFVIFLLCVVLVFDIDVSGG